MATEIILPALGMAQDTGKIVRWLKAAGEPVSKGEPVAEIETDKATVEIESPATGILADVTGAVGEEIPVGQVIARVLAAGERTQGQVAMSNGIPSAARRAAQMDDVLAPAAYAQDGNRRPIGIAASPLAARIAGEHNVDLSQIKPAGKRIQSADVLDYLQQQKLVAAMPGQSRLHAASPKARRLAREQGRDLAAITGSGPDGAILAADVLAASALLAAQAGPSTSASEEMVSPTVRQPETAVGAIWRIMAERTAQSWTTVPHFFLVREVNASHLISWRESIQRRSAVKVTYTDMLVKVTAYALRHHSYLNATWRDNSIAWNVEINIGLAVAVEAGLIVPVIQRADTLGVLEIAAQRQELVTKAQSGKLRPGDLTGGTFTISNLGMYGVDAFNAIINQPQAAILAVGRIADRVVPLNGQPAVQPMMTLSLSCDHRVVDGARGARFLETVATLLEEPLGLVD
jgi:pyruvate dehydrogenase E2 component (dihydrolipoamide acetyltransferase)